ncbi:hypothetical protein [Nocardia bovistercoris]|uniref:Uncharacterized protein n=1 Tax=Nocardia bovistercoris TaxID=2785916 RepID=A0A931N5G5_9NOCA|nr:hypothetical protein [Nocardia bovistercoris]MBH0779376.1 hypothetical protein [Nocardia bovistercoris]
MCGHETSPDTGRAGLVTQLATTTIRTPPTRRITRDEIRRLVDGLGGQLAILRAADPGGKLEVPGNSA